jgi:DNA repair protein RecN (Recombination protein N)
LGMAGAALDVQFELRDTQEVSPHGLDSVELMLAANAGVPAKALRKVASGGELSRIALALKLASIERRLQNTGAREKKRSAATLINACMAFDEVDAGIGGAVAQTVGELLQALSRSNQVLVVTHLAQIAAFADQHLFVTKIAQAQQTDVSWTSLDENAREAELARMLGGVITDKTLATAREMRARSLAVNAQNSG